MPDLKKLTENISKALGDPKKRVWVIMGIGILGMLMLLLSRDSPPISPTVQPPAAQTQITSPQEYAAQLEERLSALVSEIEGAGRVICLVTLENSGEYVFAQEEKRNTDSERNPDTTGRVLERESLEHKYVMVENEGGRRQALVRTWLEPGVQGVVIICEGADDVFVRSRVINVVTTALNISSARVCVEKIRG